MREIPVEAMKLIIREAAAVLKGHAERMHEMAAPDDWKSKTAALLTMDHVKKLAWVHDEISKLKPAEEKNFRALNETILSANH